MDKISVQISKEWVQKFTDHFLQVIGNNWSIEAIRLCENRESLGELKKWVWKMSKSKGRTGRPSTASFTLCNQPVWSPWPPPWASPCCRHWAWPPPWAPLPQWLWATNVTRAAASSDLCVFFTRFWCKILGQRLKLTEPTLRWCLEDRDIGHFQLQSPS